MLQRNKTPSKAKSKSQQARTAKLKLPAKPVLTNAKSPYKGVKPMAANKKFENINEAAAEAFKPVEAAVTAGKETVEAVMKASSEAAQKGYQQAVMLTKEQMEKASSVLFKGYDQMNALSKDNIEAVVAAGSVVAKTVEQVSKEVFAIAQSQVENNLAQAKALMGAKSLREAFDMQQDFARMVFDRVMADGAKLTEVTVKAANEAAKPIQARVNVAFEKMMKPVAA